MLFIVFGGAFIVLFLVGFSQLEKRAQLDEDLSATTAVIVPDDTAVRHMIRHERWGMLNMTWAFYAIVGIIYSIDNVYENWELILGTIMVVIATVSMFGHRLYLQDRAFRSHPIVYLIDLSIPLLVVGMGLVRLAEKHYFS